MNDKKKALLCILGIELIAILLLLLTIALGFKPTLEPIPIKHALGYHRSPPRHFIPFKYKSIVQAASDEAGVPVWLLARLINRESSWNNKLINTNRDGTKDLGLCQLNTKYIPDFEWRYNHGSKIDPFNPDTSIYVCAQILKALYKSTGNWIDTVAAYNCGLTRLLQGDIPASTLRHIDAVFGGI